MHHSEEKAPLHWPAVVVLYGTTLAAMALVPWYALTHGFGAAAWISFVVLALLNGISITAGYHRLWAHRTYEAHFVVRLFLMLFGTMATQNSILIWASGHRTHHRHVDSVEKDPYSVKRGFWFSHMGWMVRQYESGKDDFTNSPDLLKDPLVMFQHKYYLPLALAMNFGLPVVIGLMVGDLWGVVLLGGLFRLVWCHQTTFFINSLAHIWGRRPYTDENTARDNDILAVFTYGEGYHNYHHLFQYDYRNGIRWFHFDPTKWLIRGLSFVGLTRNLKRVPDFQIEKARIAMQFKRAQTKLEAQNAAAMAGHQQTQIEAFKARLQAEYDHFSQALQEWARLKEAWYEETKQQLANNETLVHYKAKFRELEIQMKAQRRRLKRLMNQSMLPA